MKNLCIFLALVAMAVPVVAQDTPPNQDPPIPADKGEVKTTESGLKYCVLKDGDGNAMPGKNDTVVCHYTGWLTDGTMFDSSRTRGEPIRGPLAGFVKGWQEGIMLMSKGARHKMTIPWNLAYGERGRAPKIPPKADLIFDVELIEIVAAPKYVKVPEDAKATESGIRYSLVSDGAGDAFDKNADGCELHFALFTTEGELVADSYRRGAPISLAQQRLEFFPEMAAMLKKGGKLVCEVPPDLCFKQRPFGPIKANSKTVWQVEMAEIHRGPKFAKSDPQNVKRTASGLAYEVLKEGTGVAPKASDRVTVHYSGWLEDGTMFDSSWARGETTSFPLNGVIKGWTEGCQLMKEGARYRFTIPSEIAYGERGSPPKIPGNATLIFVIELHKVN